MGRCVGPIGGNYIGINNADPHGVEPEDLSVLDHSSSPVLSMVDRCFCTALRLRGKRKGAPFEDAALKRGKSASVRQRSAECRSSAVRNDAASQPQ